ncbi:C-type lectin domain family 4 member D-like [Toxotes jaculatrix]|uniref:C-type lectin domain family 4 member D-like n=1 Tax=Toxotes jaculatrix TaxID=941984 RepID=UPI001B3B00F8|nr:C-type lectin domain family 4 member D-like [Toxotes jaculatrix]
MRNLINTKGALGLRSHIVLCALIGLLLPEVFARPGSPEEELSHVKLRLSSLENRYRHLCNQYANLATNCSGPEIKCTECPAWWFQVGDQCFHLSTDRQDWANSTKNCTEMGGHLAILTTREQHEAVEKESRSIGGFYTDYWIGLTDSETEGDWKWVDNSELKTPFWNALKSEPDNNLSGGPEGEDCVVVDSYSQSWFDVPCSFLYPRICQMDATPLS